LRGIGDEALFGCMSAKVMQCCLSAQRGRARCCRWRVTREKRPRTRSEAAAHAGGIYADAVAVLDRLLVTTQTQVPLHGDLHHGNLLDAGVRGWLAIDPKGLEGDPVFDYAIMLFVTEVQDGIAAPHQVIDRAQRVATMAQLPLERLLGWSLCVAAQYAGWFHGAPMGAGMLDAARVISEQSSVRGL